MKGGTLSFFIKLRLYTTISNQGNLTHKNEEHVGLTAPVSKDNNVFATSVPLAVVFLKSNMLISRDPSSAASARIFCWDGLMYI